jgi:hypothetical protein
MLQPITEPASCCCCCCCSAHLLRHDSLSLDAVCLPQVHCKARWDTSCWLLLLLLLLSKVLLLLLG